MKKEIEIENNLMLKLPKNMTAELAVDSLNWIIYFGGFHTWIPQNASKLLAEEKIKELAFVVLKSQKKVMDYLLGNCVDEILENNKYQRI